MLRDLLTGKITKGEITESPEIVVKSILFALPQLSKDEVYNALNHLEVKGLLHEYSRSIKFDGEFFT